MFKEQVVKEREFKNIRLESEEVAEFDYRPSELQEELSDGRGSQEPDRRKGRAAAV